ncbi:heme-binding protein [Candidatus Mycolicibacterium alkanivorans]|uniref:Heme-binding protein n=1 Tax=Candidatus Mycolicibacterium alkanivorans TaxID=2954114 RepID=A0ABS9YU39_9MYCO|nr:heme-binding protein [Candidatus Mycolicibacterium alkanivorans]MCI4674729.1 heme-binding protein [Candidatus Mycolicibacterium alkanivorans]
MLVNSRLARRMVVGALGAGAVAGALAAAPSALADPAPNCSAADRAGITAGVQAATSAYLFTHPDVNDFMTSLAGRPVDQVPTDVQNFLDANPQTKAELQGIRQPLADMRERCGAPLLDQP